MSNSSVILRGKTVKLFERDCLEKGDKVGKPKLAPFVDISVSMTNACNARCEFCCNQGKEDFRFDVEAFKDFFDETAGAISVNKVTFTGGEPTLRIKELNKCLTHIAGKCSLVTVNTNGAKLEALDHPYIHRIALSRHHYSDKLNDMIFGIKIGNPLVGSSLVPRVALVCNLINGLIDCTSKAYRMLEFAANNGIGIMSFVGLMPINDWSRKHLIELGSLKFERDTICTRELSYEVEGVCHCKNYAYVADNGRIVNYYMRHNLQPDFDKGSRVLWENNEMK